jgi:membrane protease YdiL (CAAX protease family)
MTESRRWGIWATSAWSVVILLLFAATQAAIVFVYVLATAVPGTEIDFADTLTSLRNDGDVLSIATLIGALIGVPAVLGAIKLKRGARIGDYLPLILPRRRALMRWLFATALWIAASDLISFATGEPIVPEFMREAYSSSSHKILLGFAMVGAAPIFEETLFRGFMLAGLWTSRLGAAGAVIITSLAWAAIHGQYDLYGKITIVAFGLLLGAARVTTGSVLVPVILHATVNAFATLEVVVWLGEL